MFFLMTNNFIMQKNINSDNMFFVRLCNRNFRVLYKHRDEKNYSLIGAGTIFKLIDEITALNAIRTALQSDAQVIKVDVKNVVNFKFYSK
jgi:hypothetical protein